MKWVFLFILFQLTLGCPSTPENMINFMKYISSYNNQVDITTDYHAVAVELVSTSLDRSDHEWCHQITTQTFGESDKDKINICETELHSYPKVLTPLYQRANFLYQITLLSFDGLLGDLHSMIQICDRLKMID